jgi:thiamine-monophosphate kinase
MTVSDLTEAELVARIHSHLQSPPGWLLVGIGDDAAVVEPERNKLEVLTVDALVEGVHFDRRLMPPDAIGHRALAVNLSDLAAMGASPRLALVSLALPEDMTSGDFDRMTSGIAGLARRHRLHVVGGNLTRSPGPLVIDVTVAGSAKRRQVLTRGGARPGDEIYVTGTVGGAAAGLQMLRGSTTGAGGKREGDPACIHRYRYPVPRIGAGVQLARNRAAVACMDLSDGLADGVRQIAAASGVGIAIDGDLVPVDPAARRWFESTGLDPLVTALTGGDDYELVFASRAALGARLRAVRQRSPALTRVGVCTREPDVVLHRVVNGARTEEAMPGGYTHFG